MNRELSKALTAVLWTHNSDKNIALNIYRNARENGFGLDEEQYVSFGMQC